MKNCIVLILLTAMHHIAVGQQNPVTGDYRTAATSTWGHPNAWQVYYNGDWRALSSTAAGPYRNVFPTSASGTVTIRFGHTITFNVPNTTQDQVVIENGGTIFVHSVYDLVIVDDQIHTPLTIKAGGMLTNNGGIVLPSQPSNVPSQIYGTMKNIGGISGSNTSQLIFHSGSVYQHSRNGGGIPLATWDINSTCLIDGLTGTYSPPPGNLGQAFGNFTWNTPAMGPTTVFHLGGALRTVNGNLTFVNTGTTPREIHLSYKKEGYDLFVGGDFIVQGGLVTLTRQLLSASSIRIAGNLIVSGGTLTLSTINGWPLNVYLKGALQKTGGVLAGGNGPGSCTIFGYDQ